MLGTGSARGGSGSQAGCVPHFSTTWALSPSKAYSSFRVYEMLPLGALTRRPPFLGTEDVGEATERPLLFLFQVPSL